jgi:hypothetical protein
MELIMLRMAKLLPKIPSWAKAEQMEISVSKKELWKYRDSNSVKNYKQINPRKK